MSPIEYIAEGIKEGNWETVCEGYERLTGKSLPLPAVSLTTDDANSDAIRRIADIVLGLGIEEPTKKKKQRGRPKGSGKKVKKTSSEDDSIQLDNEKKTSVQKESDGVRLITNDPDPEEVAKNKKRSIKAKKNKIKLNRQVARTFKVKCSECENSFESDRQSGEIGQKCPKCLSGKKSRFV